MMKLFLLLALNFCLLACTLCCLGLNWQGISGCAFTECLMLLAIIDWYYGILPDNLTLPLLWGGLVVNLFQLFTSLSSAVLGAILGYLSLWSFYWLFKLSTGKDGMGYGDFKLLAALGAWLGWQYLTWVILIASVLSLMMILVHYMLTAQWLFKLPFGPGLALAGLVILYSKPYFSIIF